MSLQSMLADLAPIGRDPRSGGYRRFAWTHADASLREWFTAEAQRRSLDVIGDRAGNLWAWSGNPDVTPGVVLGSHLDSVPDGGAYDGPLGVVSGFAALDLLRARGQQPDSPIGIACFADEEGARFGIACTGSRLLTGELHPDAARRLTDASGDTLAQAAGAAGVDVQQLGRDEEALRRIGAFVELHIEQGRGLVELGAPVGVADSIWPHGRWRLDLAGRADHAGTTRLVDRDDPMLRLAAALTTARGAAQAHDALATIGRVDVYPGAVNAIASSVTAWLDARGARAEDVRAIVADVAEACQADPVEESWTSGTSFEPALRNRLAVLLGSQHTAAPVLATGAGHDAGILAAAGIPTAMLFVRNPTGVSHSPDEHADLADCSAGAAALATVVSALS